MCKGYKQRCEHDALEFQYETLGKGLLLMKLRPLAFVVAFIFPLEEPPDEVKGAFYVEVLDNVVGRCHKHEALEDVEEEVIDDAEHVGQ